MAEQAPPPTSAVLMSLSKHIAVRCAKVPWAGALQRTAARALCAARQLFATLRWSLCETLQQKSQSRADLTT